jgi:hypothetical protein
MAGAITVPVLFLLHPLLSALADAWVVALVNSGT